jgi:hypothetical protein
MTKGYEDETAPNSELKDQDSTEGVALPRLADFLQRAIKAFNDKLDKSEIKPTIGDYLKLLQLERELDQERETPKEIRVSWVEPQTASSTDE